MEEINITAETKEELYREILPMIHSLVNDESDPVANMANCVAALKQTFAYYSWVGFYLYDKSTNELVLGPFQGKVACTRIGIGKGVCGISFQKNEAIIVPDVEKFPGHIYCDGGTKSEIVIPIRLNNAIMGVLDVDSYALNSFDATDHHWLHALMTTIAERISNNR
jgi:GAF domain-containing protein